MAEDNKTRGWVTLLKLAAVVIVLLSLLALGLYYTAKYNTYKPVELPPDNSWGISKDSPIRNKR